ncbi:hypothetical protein ANO14919_068160 [Xylariales sp. No.14919]|nr:hypothetical protein ANO14919_068160 [Xylariales sp. No.14919]
MRFKRSSSLDGLETVSGEARIPLGRAEEANTRLTLYLMSSSITLQVHRMIRGICFIIQAKPTVTDAETLISLGSSMKGIEGRPPLW